jgi:hypothetical protein
MMATNRLGFVFRTESVISHEKFRVRRHELMNKSSGDDVDFLPRKSSSVHWSAHEFHGDSTIENLKHPRIKHATRKLR